MCGICFCLITSKFNSISFDFFPYLAFIENSFASLNIQDLHFFAEITTDYYQHCFKNNLFLSDFTIPDLENCLKPRGPDTFNILINSDDLSVSYVPKLLKQRKLFENLATINPEHEYKTLAAGSVLHLRGE